MSIVSGRARDERGVVLPTRLLALCISAVAVAGLVFIANDPDQPATEEATPARTTPSKAPAASEQPTPTVSAKPKPKVKPIKRGDVLVTVFNNTRTKGLAGGAAGKAKAGGWNVVGSDNWYGTIPASTVYYPQRMERAGKLLALDLGIQRTAPAVDPMRLDRLTVILTAPLD